MSLQYKEPLLDPEWFGYVIPPEGVWINIYSNRDDTAYEIGQPWHSQASSEQVGSNLKHKRLYRIHVKPKAAANHYIPDYEELMGA